MNSLYYRLLDLEQAYNRIDELIESDKFGASESVIKALNHRNKWIHEYNQVCVELARVIGIKKLKIQSKRANVLDKGWVEFQDMMGDDLAIVSCARTSFLGESKGTEKDNRLLRRLMRDCHTSPFEMVQFRFRLRAPVVVWWQWVRHRMQSYNLQSGRYVEFDEDDFYVPDEWRLQSKTNKQGSDGDMDKILGNWLTLGLEHHYYASYCLYKSALSEGVAREQARLFLPAWGSYYTGIISVNAHNLMHFLKLRMAEDAQWEIRQYANVIYHEFFKELLPVTAKAFEDYRL